MLQLERCAPLPALPPKGRGLGRGAARHKPLGFNPSTRSYPYCSFAPRATPRVPDPRPPLPRDLRPGRCTSPTDTPLAPPVAPQLMQALNRRQPAPGALRTAGKFLSQGSRRSNGFKARRGGARLARRSDEKCWQYSGKLPRSPAGWVRAETARANWERRPFAPPSPRRSRAMGCAVHFARGSTVPAFKLSAGWASARPSIPGAPDPRWTPGAAGGC
jgi:hypothetical protein